MPNDKLEAQYRRRAEQLAAMGGKAKKKKKKKKAKKALRGVASIPGHVASSA